MLYCGRCMAGSYTRERLEWAWCFHVRLCGELRGHVSARGA
jgi:hypothetical protein